MASNNGLRDKILIVAKKHRSTSYYSPPSPSSSPPSPILIQEIPSTLRNIKPKAYTPRVVSIGLINRNPDMDEHKEIYMSSLFWRTVPPCETTEMGDPFFDKGVGLCVDSMISMADAARESYPVSSRSLDPEITARTMLLDGCFILELLIRWSTRSIDPFIQNRSFLNNIVHDLLLLENQIPFFVLKELYERTICQIPQSTLMAYASPSSFELMELILNFICSPSNSHFKSLKISRETLGEIEACPHHILSLVHSYYLPLILVNSYNISLPQKSERGDYMVTRYSATEIFRSGIKLKPSKNEEVHLDVRFQTPCLFSWFPSIITSIFLFPWRSASRKLPLFTRAQMKSARASCCWLFLTCQLCRRATLEIPELCIADSTESFLRNLIAYEQSSANIPHYITSYAFLMDTIINTKEDIEMLKASGVLKNYLGSSEAASDLFNSLCTNVNLGDNFYFTGQWKQVDAYCNLYWPNVLGSCKVTYFSNPWTGISVFAALVLFAFTGLQTACTVIQTWFS